MVEPAGLPVGHQAVDDLDPGVGQHGDRAGGGEVDIIGVRHHDEDTFDLGWLQHQPSQRPSRTEHNRRLMSADTATVSSLCDMTLPDVPLADFDLSDVGFWTAPRDYRDGAFKTLRDTPGLRFYEEALIEDSPFPRGAGLLRAQPPRGHLAGQPQRHPVLLGPGFEHR